MPEPLGRMILRGSAKLRPSKLIRWRGISVSSPYTSRQTTRRSR
jgi:hypothetical protein